MKAAEVEEDRVAEARSIAEAACVALDGLDEAVEALGSGVGDAPDAGVARRHRLWTLPVMSAPKSIPPKLLPWFEARRRFNLSHATVQMARELGLNPKKLGSLADIRASPWKAPLAEAIAHWYYKAHKRDAPEVVRSLEQLIKDNEDKKARRRERKAQRAGLEPTAMPEQAPRDSAADQAC